VPDKDSAPEFDFDRVLRILRRRKLVIIACFIVVPVAALAFSLSQRKEYSATTTLLFQDPQLTSQITGSLTVVPDEDPARVAATSIQLSQLNVVSEDTTAALRRPIGSVSVSGNSSTDVINITTTEPTPALAALVANTYASQYVSFRRHEDVALIDHLRNLIGKEYSAVPADQRASAQARGLADTDRRLGILASLQTGNVQVVQQASPPSSPSSPTTKRNVALGLAIGLLFGLVIAFVWEFFDRRLREPSELEEIFQRPILVGVPQAKELRAAAAAAGAPPARVVEAFHMLRANLRYFNVDRQVKTLLVTSSLPGEGKTTVAWNFAYSAARAGLRVLIVEADLRRPALASRYGPFTRGGITTLLSSPELSLAEAVDRVQIERLARGNGHFRDAYLDVLSSGPKPPNPSDLVESDRMRQIVEQARDVYDLVVIDTPPLSVVSDAIPLISHVDGVLVVCRLRKITREAATHLHKQLERLSAPVIGIVANDINKTDSYGYGYGSYYTSEARSYVEDSADDGSGLVPMTVPSNGAHTEAASGEKVVEFDDQA